MIYICTNNLIVIKETLTTDLESLISNVNSVTVDQFQRNVESTTLSITEGNIRKLMDIYLEMVDIRLNFIHFT